MLQRGWVPIDVVGDLEALIIRLGRLSVIIQINSLHFGRLPPRFGVFIDDFLPLIGLHFPQSSVFGELVVGEGQVALVGVVVIYITHVAVWTYC